MNYYYLGIIFGVLFALGAFIIACFIHKKRHPNTGKYDERQTLGRGRAFQAGFFTLLIAGAICNIWDYVSPLPGGSFLWNIGVLLLGVTVFAVTAIHFDAYVGMYDNPRRFLTMGACFTLAMGLSAVSNFHSDRPFQRNLGILNLGVGLMWIIIVAALLLHRRSMQKEEE